MHMHFLCIGVFVLSSLINVFYTVSIVPQQFTTYMNVTYICIMHVAIVECVLCIEAFQLLKEKCKFYQRDLQPYAKDDTW